MTSLDTLTVSVWKILPSSITNQIFYPERKALLDSRIHRIRLIPDPPVNKLQPKKSNTTHPPHFNPAYNDLPVEIQTIDSISQQKIKHCVPEFENISLKLQLENPLTLPKHLQEAAPLPHFVLFNDSLLVRVQNELSFRFWMLDFVWIQQKPDLDESSFYLLTPEGQYKLESSLWLTVLSETIGSYLTKHNKQTTDSRVETKDNLDLRTDLHYVYQSGPLEGFSYHGSWIFGHQYGWGQLCWPAVDSGRSVSPVTAIAEDDHVRKSSVESQHQKQKLNLMNQFDLDQEDELLMLNVPDTVRQFLKQTGPLAFCEDIASAKIISVFYEGQFWKNRINGLGELSVQTTQGAASVRAEWYHNRPHGLGCVRHIHGDNYSGWFVNGSRHGHGFQESFHRNPSSDTHVQNQRRNTLSTVYLGNWSDDKKDGFGIEDDVSNGNVYAGLWKSNAIFGQGIKYNASGYCIAGDFKQSGIQGPGLCTAPSGHIYTGMMSKSEPRGQGILRHLFSNLQLVGYFDGSWTAIGSDDPSASDPSKRLNFKGHVTLMNPSRQESVPNPDCWTQSKVQILAPTGAMRSLLCYENLDSLVEDVVKQLVNGVQTGPVSSQPNLSDFSKIEEPVSTCYQSDVKLAELLLTHMAPLHLRWTSLFTVCINSDNELRKITHSLSLVNLDVNTVDTVSISNINGSTVSLDSKTLKHDDPINHILLDLIENLARYSFPSHLGGLALVSVNDLLCELLNDLQKDSKSVTKLANTSKKNYWVKSFRLIAALLAECFNTLCLSGRPRSVFGPNIFSTSGLLITALCECAYIVANLAYAFQQAIRTQLILLNPINQTEESNAVPTVIQPIEVSEINWLNQSSSVETSPIENQSTDAVEEDTNSGVESELRNKSNNEDVSAHTFLASLPEVQLTGSITLLDLALDCLIPGIYPTLFGFFEAKYASSDATYRQFCKSLSVKSDEELYSYLELEKSLQLWYTETESAFHPAAKIFARIEHVQTPAQKLLVIGQTYACVSEILHRKPLNTTTVPTTNIIPEPPSTSNKAHRKSSSSSIADQLELPSLDQLLPVIRFVVIRAELPKLGAELAFIDHLTPERLSSAGILTYLVTTIHACYGQVLREAS